MSAVTIGLLGFLAVLVLGATRMPVALALAFVGALGTGLLEGTQTLKFVVATAPMDVLNNYALSSLPLFLLMGAAAARSGMSKAMFDAANGFIGHRRAGLAMASVFACAGFSSISGSSLATVVTMGRITIPEMLRLGYAPRLAAGTIAAGGAIGALIPPSIPMIFYALLTETSVGRLFAAGLVPAAITILFYCMAIGVWAWLRPEIGPPSRRTDWRMRLHLLRAVTAPLLLFLLVIGGIYGGVFNAVEASGIGAAGAILIALLQRRFDLMALLDCVRESVLLAASMFLLFIGVDFFHFFIEAAALPKVILSLITAMNLPPWGAISIILAFLVALGCILEAPAILFIMTPVLFPIVTSLGYDPVWFGIAMMMVIEFGVIVPPFGLNVFVICGTVDKIPLTEAFRGVGPFIIADLIRLPLIILSPGLVLWLPNLLGR